MDRNYAKIRLFLGVLGLALLNRYDWVTETNGLWQGVKKFLAG